MAIPYDLDVLYRNPKAQAKIFFPSEGTVDFNGNRIHPEPIIGLMKSDIQTDISSSFSDVDPGQTSSIQHGVNAATNLFGGANRVVKNVQQTLQQWNGHSSPKFQIPIVVVKYKPSIDVLGIVRTLMSAPAGTYEGLTLKAPYGYGISGIVSRLPLVLEDLQKSIPFIGNNVNSSDSALYRNFSSLVTGTYTLKISDWFIANDLIIDHVSAIISKETIKGTNEPLYAELTVSFTTAYLPDARTIAEWFLPSFIDYGAPENNMKHVGDPRGTRR